MLLAGLAVDPNNTEVLTNLQATYAWLAASPAATGARLGRWRPAWCGSMPTCVPGQAPMPLRSGWRSAAAGSISPVPTPAVIGCASTAAPRRTRSSRRVSFRISSLPDWNAAGTSRKQLCAALRAGPQDAQEFSTSRSCSERSKVRRPAPAKRSRHASPRPALPPPRSTHALRKSSSCATRSASQTGRSGAAGLDSRTGARMLPRI